MDTDISPETLKKLETAQNIWFGSVRPDGRPHLTPIWFVVQDRKIYVSIDPNSVKRRNIAQNPNVVLALEEGTHPVIVEGTAKPLSEAPAPELLAKFHEKYEWDIPTDEQYNFLVEVTPKKWLAW